MTDDSKLTPDQEIRLHALNLATVLRRESVRLKISDETPDGLGERVVRDANLFAAFLIDGAVPEPVAGSREAAGARWPDVGDTLPDGRVVVEADDDRFDDEETQEGEIAR